MPDVRTLLHDSAAEPSNRLDLDELRRRSARRRTTRRGMVLSIAAVTIIGVVGLSVLLADDPSDRVELVGPAGPGDLDSWSALGGLVPAPAWDGMMNFGRPGADSADAVGFGSDTTGMRTALGFDPGDFELWANGGVPPNDITIATGDFDPAIVDAAVRADADWAPLLEVVTHRGWSFYSWGADRAIVGDPSPGRPLGRGGRLLVTEEVVVWTQGSEEMRAIIDRLVDGPADAPPTQARLIEWAEQDGTVSVTVFPTEFISDDQTAGPSALALGSGEPPRPGWVRTFGAVAVEGSEPLPVRDVEVALDDLRAGVAPDVDPLVQPGADELARQVQLLAAAGELEFRSGVHDDGYWLSFDFPDSTSSTGDQVDDPLSAFAAVLQALHDRP